MSIEMPYQLVKQKRPLFFISSFYHYNFNGIWRIMVIIENEKVALVTGGSAGIGRATALALARQGYLTYAAARHPEIMADPLLPGLIPLRLDVTDKASLVAAVQQIEATHGAIDVLVNSAGYSEMGPIEEMSLERLRRQFETNVFGLVCLCQLVLPGMRSKGWGRIVNVSSMGGEFTIPFSGVYHASKYALEALSDALRFEVQPFGVDVVVIQPGVVQTPLGKSTQDSLQSAPDSPYAARIVRFRQFLEANSGPGESAVLQPEDVADVILQAVQSDHPQTRYKIGAEAEQLPALRRRLSDREWDDMYRQIFGTG
ncbi:MAG: SDR family NAD(P)-dependent oxidoreductase [Negativicutes bacterium]|nr:SDR family NAD(P)-dependent oxidoreductase [Negativicutes bacterium]